MERKFQVALVLNMAASIAHITEPDEISRLDVMGRGI